MRRRNQVVLVAIAVVIVIQFIPVDRSNPPVQGELNAPPAVAEILRASCYDCHSNETQWPWYSYVAPVSWMLAHHVGEGREKLNFSTWSDLAEKDRIKMVHEIWEETSQGQMPLRVYLIMHPKAKLSDGAIERLRMWSESLGGEDVSDRDA
jgi:hypothetical protein